MLIVKDRPITIEPGSGAHVLARTNNGPAIVELTLTETRAIIVGFDPLDSTWPLDVSFPAFIASASPSVIRAPGRMIPAAQHVVSVVISISPFDGFVTGCERLYHPFRKQGDNLWNGRRFHA